MKHVIESHEVAILKMFDMQAKKDVNEENKTDGRG